MNSQKPDWFERLEYLISLGVKIPHRDQYSEVGLSFLIIEMKSPMRDRINSFFDLVELVNRRLPSLHHFVVNIALLGLLLLGVYALFTHHP